MTQQLVVVRHAQAVDKLKHKGHDRYRDLTSTGVKQARKTAQELHDKHIKPTIIITSAAPRAYHTAVIIGRELEVPPNSIVVDSNLYRCGVQKWLETLAYYQSFRCVMIVGHNPELLELCHILMDKPPSKLPKAWYIIHTFTPQ